MTTIFNRNDKGSEPAPAGNAPAEKSEAAPGPQNALATEPSKHALASAQLLNSNLSGQRGVSVISRALKITGQLESSEDIQIEGLVEGDVRAVTVRVGAGAKVHGTVSGDEVELSGTIDGKIEAKKVVLTSSAHMSGDVVHQDISIQSGAFIAGNLIPYYGKAESNVQPIKAAVE
jgi:cytoskeletal protein CcmA (bactofilin family)